MLGLDIKFNKTKTCNLGELGSCYSQRVMCTSNLASVWQNKNILEFNTQGAKVIIRSFFFLRFWFSFAFGKFPV